MPSYQDFKKCKLYRLAKTVSGTGGVTNGYEYDREIRVCIRQKSSYTVTSPVMFQDCTHIGISKELDLIPKKNKLVVDGIIYDIIDATKNRRSCLLILKRGERHG